MSKTNSFPASVLIYGIRLANLSMDDVLSAIDAALVSKTRCRITFVNADCVNIAAKNNDYKKDLDQMDWVFIDGIGMKIAGMILNQPVRSNVNGTDLFPLLCKNLAKQGGSLYLLGAKPGVADAVAKWAIDQFPGIVIAGSQHGYFAEGEAESVVAKIHDSHADVLLVAMGAPQQEAWINRYMQSTGSIIAIGVGGLFDYYSGNIPRAPYWMRKSGLEWLFRLIQEPKRLGGRYLIGNWTFLARIIYSKLFSGAFKG